MKLINISPIYILGLFIISVFLLFFISSISYQQIKSLDESGKLVARTKDINAELEHLYGLIEFAQSTQRGYLTTNDLAYLDPYYSVPNKIDTCIHNLRLLMADNVHQQANLNVITVLIHRKNASLEDEVSAKKNNISNAELVTQIQFGNLLMDSIRVKINDMNSLELKSLQSREKEHAHDVKLTPKSTLVLLFFSLFIFIFSFYKINKDRINLKKINNQLLITKETFEHAEQIAEISNWSWDIDKNKLSFSNNQYRLLGCQPHEFTPSVENFLEFVHPDDRAIILEGNNRVLADAQPSVSYFRIIRKDGKQRYFKSLGKLISDSYGKKIMIGINSDITDQYNKDKTLEEKVFELERSNNELSAFNHVASHDLQEPLRKIQTFISRIETSDLENLSERGKDYFKRIVSAANRMQVLIDDLLMFSRTNKANKVFEISDLNELLSSSKQELMQSIDEKSANVTSDRLPTINVIPFQIRQLFFNIIGNSLKYSKAEIIPEINITSKLVSGKDIPDANTANDKPYYKISITDNGIGFEPKYADSIFNLFNRLHEDKEYSGTGIGLTICKKIVENHKGFIRAQGFPDKGSIFDFYLPVD